MALDQIADRVAVLSLVGQHDGAQCKIIEQDIGRAAIGNLTTRQQEAEWPAFAIGERVQLAVAAARLIPIAWTSAPLFRRPPSGAPSCACCR